MAALVALALYEFLRRIGLNARAALAVAALIACSSPLSSGAVRLYAEVGGTLLLLLALLCVDNWRIGRWSALVAAPLVALCLAGVVLFHSRLLPAALVIAGMGIAPALARLARRAGGASRRQLAGAGGLAAAGVGLLALAVVAALAFEPRLRPDYLRKFILLDALGPQSFGILFDRASGLFPAVPVLLLSVGGFVWLIRRAPFLGWTSLLIVVAQVAAIAIRQGGWETWGPPGRYIYPSVPFWALALGAAWCWGFAHLARPLAGGLAALGIAVTAFSWWLPLGLHYGNLSGSSYWFAAAALPPLLGANPFLLFPALPSNVTASWAVVLPWLGVLAAGGLLAVRWHRRVATPTPLAPSTPPSPEADAPVLIAEVPRDEAEMLAGARERRGS